MKVPGCSHRFVVIQTLQALVGNTVGVWWRAASTKGGLSCQTRDLGVSARLHVRFISLFTTFRGKSLVFKTWYKTWYNRLRAESDGVVAVLLLSTGPQSGSAAFVVSVDVGVGAVALCKVARPFSRCIKSRNCCRDDALK